MSNFLDSEHFKDVLKAVEEQVFRGKGNERHGTGADSSTIDLEDQPWAFISKSLNTDAGLLFQATKKVLEMSKFDDLEAFRREAYGAIVYITFAIMFRESNADR